MLILHVQDFELHLDQLPPFADEELAVDWHLLLFSIWFAGSIAPITYVH